MNNDIFYELCDTSDDEMYFTLGMFRTLDEIKIEITTHDAIGEKISDYSEDYEELTVVEHKFGWTKIRKEVMTIKRESIFDELIDDYVWKTIDIDEFHC